MTEPNVEPDDSALSYIERLALADPDTTLGKLQRGRGAGWLECLELPREEAHDLLWQCITADPRWDQQIERREDYYVSLARLTNLDVDRFRPQELPPAEEWRDRRLLYSVLSDLDVAGVPAAGSALLEHLGPEDDSRDFVLSEVLRASPETISQLPEALSSRRTDEQLEATVDRWLEDFPWETWARTNGRIAAALGQAQEIEEPERTPSPRPSPPPADASIAELLTYEWHQIHDEVFDRTDPLQPEERRLLIEACSELEVPRLPFLLLGRMNDPGGIDAALAIFDKGIPGGRMGLANRYIGALGKEHTLPLAREWLESERPYPAARILGRHAEVEDLLAVRKRLAEAWDQREIYPLCDMLESLKRLPEEGPFEELAEIFEGVEYSYARSLAAEGMAASDPAFRSRFARECLWDCDLETAEVGFDFVDTKDDQAVARVAELTSEHANRRGMYIGRLTKRDLKAAGLPVPD